ncbi:sporulation membrane protein YtrI [Bacillus marinisedimentorum]|uniref:sporulation membrane protein YtrI n=1 Tax=Bacillus marinisedimentorum TaxID=1821260 RepID=UPI0009F4750F|nr:sporulation membrane protein YtrI [Bacillus marinisedimentorum]
MMRVPDYSQDPGWQRFFAGAAAGAIVSWVIFLFLFGEIQEKNTQTIITQQSSIRELEHRINLYNEEKIKLNNENEKKLKVQELSIQFSNSEKLKLELLTVHQLREEVEEQLQDVIGRDIETAARTKGLIYRAVESKVYNIDDQEYSLKIIHSSLYTTFELTLSIKKR